MAEIKTCEQYVLAKLESAENRIAHQEYEIKLKNSQIIALAEELETLKAFICRRAELITDDGDDRVHFDDPWLKYDLEDYEYISKILKEQKKED